MTWPGNAGAGKWSPRTLHSSREQGEDGTKPNWRKAMQKVINIVLGRGQGYSRTTSTLRAEEFTATVAIDEGKVYPTERSVPEELAAKMAEAAYGVLIDSGFFSPSFDSAVVAFEPPAPTPEPQPQLADNTPDII